MFQNHQCSFITMMWLSNGLYLFIQLIILTDITKKHKCIYIYLQACSS